MKRSMDPNDNRNWALVCSACGAEFESSETIDLASGHFQEEHPELDHPHFSTVWKGIGRAPKGQQRPYRGGRR